MESARQVVIGRDDDAWRRGGIRMIPFFKRQSLEPVSPSHPAAPDFLGIGMQKAGTLWLYDLLSNIEDFWMPPIKEIHHFDSSAARPRNLGKIRETALSMERPCRFKRKSSKGLVVRPRDARDYAYARAAIRYVKSGRSDDAYMDLFRAAGDRLTGDITPDYSGLDEETVRKVSELLPNVRIILAVRDPVSRAWSAFNMHLRRQARYFKQFRRRRELPAVVRKQATAENLIRFLTDTETESLSFPSRTYLTWSKYFRHLLVLSFDEIVVDGQSAAARVAEFFGILNVSSRAKQVENKKAGGPKAELQPECERILVDYFEAELLRSQQVLGDLASEWPKRYGIK